MEYWTRITSPQRISEYEKHLGDKIKENEQSEILIVKYGQLQLKEQKTLSCILLFYAKLNYYELTNVYIWGT